MAYSSKVKSKKKSSKQNEPLSVEDEFKKIRQRYEEESKKRGFNSLIYGDFGTGKTHLLHTAPKPILVHSFDPGGSVTLRKWIDKGEVLVDNRFEMDEDDRGNPKAYREWEAEFERLRKGGMFENIGTYVIDSITTMSESLMNAIMTGNDKQKSANSTVKTFIPQLRDYQVQIYTIRDFINVCCGLPCNFICTGHIDRSKDEVSGKVISTPMLTGKQAQKLPMLFDEVYVTQTKQTSKGTDYYMLTQSDGIYQARSRMAANSDEITAEMPQDICNILDKANFPYENKPLFK